MVEDLCRSAQAELLLVAPFIKTATLKPLLDLMPEGVAVRCVTRWWPHEIAAGVSDLEVWELFRGHDSRTLFLRHDLHAKLYKTGERCLVGSVNLTGKALGTVSPPNLELLVEVTPASTKAFEDELWLATVEVDDQMCQAMRELVDALPVPMPSARPAPTHRQAGAATAGLAGWIPRTRHPENLLIAYRGGASENLSRAAAEAAAGDLDALAVPEGLDEDSFRQAVGVLLLQTPVAAAVDRFATTERRFGEIRDLVARHTGEDDGSRSWQTLLRWLTHFLPGRYGYRRPKHSELFSRL